MKDYASVINNYFEGEVTTDKFCDVVNDVLQGIDDLNDDDSIAQGVADNLIYEEDRWEMMMHYQSADQANYDEAYEAFLADISAIAETMIYYITYM